VEICVIFYQELMKADAKNAISFILLSNTVNKVIA